jgi:hypothetical protein
MKSGKVFLAVLVVGSLAVVGFVKRSQRPDAALPVPAPEVVAVEVDPPDLNQTKAEAEEIFRRAFWQPPGAADKILHAERREWVDAADVKKWRWFLEVEASPELRKYLQKANAFGLSPAQEVAGVEKAPAWFVYPASGVDFLKSRRGQMTLCFSKSGNRLFATDAGSGFRPGAPEPTIAPDSGRPTSAGRLPNSMPPTPAPKSR